YNEYISDSIYLPLTQSTAARATLVKACAERIRKIPDIVAAAKESLKNPSRALVEVALRQNRGAVGFYEKGLFDLVTEPAQRDGLRPAAEAVVPVLKEYQKFLEDELLAKAAGDWRLGK